jgi:hypothetical protein
MQFKRQYQYGNRPHEDEFRLMVLFPDIDSDLALKAMIVCLELALFSRFEDSDFTDSVFSTNPS